MTSVQDDTKALDDSSKFNKLHVDSEKAVQDNDDEYTIFLGGRVKKGGWKTSPFIFGNEICEKLGAIGLQVNLITYLTQQLHYKTPDAAKVLSNFGGTAALTPLVGALIADAYLGRFWVVLIGSILYTIGSVVLTTQALFPSLRPAQCPAKSFECEHASFAQLGVLYLAFFFLASGSGGIRPCVAAFGADQFNENDPKQRDQVRHFFNWYYFSLQFAILLTSTVFVWIQDNVGWVVGLGIPAILMFLSILSFIFGTPIYRMVKPHGSPLSRLAHVLTAAIRKRKLEHPEDPDELYGAKDKLDSPHKLQHTDQFRFLDKAAILTDDDRKELGEGNPANPWRLCSLQSVEEYKLLVRMLPIWMTSIMVFTAWSQHGSFWVQQGRTMEKHIFGRSFEIPPGSMTFFTAVMLLISVPVYDKVGIPLLRRLTGHPRGITFLQRIGVGLFLAIFTMGAAALSEMKRKDAAAHAGLLDSPYKTVPISIFWLLPQYLSTGVVELFLFIGHMEFFYDQAPESMRSLSVAVFWLMIGSGSYLNTLLISLVQKYTDWLPSVNLNRGKLENLFWLMSGILLVNFGAFLVCAKWYRYKLWNEVKLSDNEKDSTISK